MKQLFRLLLLACFSLLVACATTPRPNNVENICHVFKQYPKWYWHAQSAQKKWKVPIHVQMAIIYQESRFTAKAKPPRKKLLWIIPWKRPSSAYGYTQALETTWKHYKKKNGKWWGVKRDEFDDATDFIGWYAYTAHKKAGIPLDDTYRLYLAYHEGVGGYQRKTYLKKPWLIRVARKVKGRSMTYQKQLWQCRKSLKSKPWYRVW